MDTLSRRRKNEGNDEVDVCCGKDTEGGSRRGRGLWRCGETTCRRHRRGVCTRRGGGGWGRSERGRGRGCDVCPEPGDELGKEGDGAARVPRRVACGRLGVPRARDVGDGERGSAAEDAAAVAVADDDGRHAREVRLDPDARELRVGQAPRGAVHLELDERGRRAQRRAAVVAVCARRRPVERVDLRAHHEPVRARPRAHCHQTRARARVPSATAAVVVIVNRHGRNALESEVPARTLFLPFLGIVVVKTANQCMMASHQVLLPSKSVLCNRKWVCAVSAICDGWQRGTHVDGKAMQPTTSPTNRLQPQHTHHWSCTPHHTPLSTRRGAHTYGLMVVETG